MAWFIIYYFTHNIDLLSQARKNFRPQNSNDDTAITEQSDYVWDPEWSPENYPFFQQNKNKKQTSYQMDYLSSDDDFLQPDIFAPYNQEYRGQGIQNVDKEYRNHIQIIEFFLHNR